MFSKKFFVVLASIFLIFSAVKIADAGSWTQIKEDPGGNVCYVNIADVKLRGAMATYWYKTENNSHRLSKVRGSINCKTDESLILKVIYYEADGSVRFSSRVKDPEWKPIEPGSMVSKHKDLLCEGDAARSHMDFRVLNSANRSRWVDVSADASDAEDGHHLLVDMKNLSETDDIVTCWNERSDTDSPKVLSKLAIDCRGGMLKKLDLIEFDSEGEPVWNTSESSWEDISPDSDIERLSNELCSKNEGAPKNNAGTAE